MSLAIFTNIWVIFIIGFTTISPWALLQALPREKKATAPGHWISTHQPKMTASSHIIHSPNWHRGWTPTSSGIWSAWSFPQLLLKSLFFFSNVKQKFPFLLFPITLLIAQVSRIAGRFFIIWAPSLLNTFLRGNYAHLQDHLKKEI